MGHLAPGNSRSPSGMTTKTATTSATADPFGDGGKKAKANFGFFIGSEAEAG